MYTAPIDDEWAGTVAMRGVDSSELQGRWETVEAVHGAQDVLSGALDELRTALCLGVEGIGSRDRLAAASAEFEQALAEFRETARLTEPYRGGV